MQTELTHRADSVSATAEPGSLTRQELRELATNADSSSSPARDAGEAFIAWRALVDGRSTVVDQFDVRGRRYIIVRRRQVSSKLTPRERQVLYHAALGYSGKRIAYEIGISQSTVALHLKSAANKLGYRSRVCLVLALAAARCPLATYCLGSPPK
jgi:DNA-binding NarL/FixJ family response regulator